MIGMKSRLTRGLLTAVITGFLVISGGCLTLEQGTLETQAGILSALQTEMLGTISHLETIQSYQATQIGSVSHMAGPVATTAAPEIPVITFTPSPTATTIVYGSVVIEDGICCAGGLAGDEIEINVAFEAFSDAGEVVEMRLVTTFSRPGENRLVEEDWVPYESEMTFSTQLAVNWVGWWIGVQYRDDLGNLSPIYYDDISLEGH